MLDSYVKQQWYFVAVKINLGQGLSGNSFRDKLKLASGELHPLQISFASDHCVYPLKISSVNGQPSEVQVYVLSPEPLLERTMLEKKLPEIYSNDLARAKKSAEPNGANADAGSGKCKCAFWVEMRQQSRRQSIAVGGGAKNDAKFE